jgi:membrane peptidoglycan carboxypeptidase
MYVNSVYWGQAKGFAIGGIEQAARWYFDAPVESLGVVEGATLAAMIPAPNVLDPFERPDRVLEKRNIVLHTMEETHKLPAARRRGSRCCRSACAAARCRRSDFPRTRAM